MRKTFRLEDILPTKKQNPPSYVRYPVYQKKTYIDGLRKNYIDCGLDPSRVDVIDSLIPEVKQRQKKEDTKELPINDYETIRVSFEYMDDGYVKIHVNTSMWDMFETYYKNAKNPPIELKVDAYRSLGYSEEFLQQMVRRDDNNRLRFEKIGAMIEKIFEKEPVKKVKKPKAKEVVVCEDEILEDEIEEDEEEDVAPDDDEILVDEDADNDDDYVEEDIELEDEGE